MNSEKLTKLPGSPGCFICDNNGSNPRALRLELMWNEADQTVQTDFKPDQTWCGYSNVVHGGLIAAVLDETMAWAVKKQSGEWAFTVDFHLRYKKAVEPGQSYVAKASAAGIGTRKITAQASVYDQGGQLTAQAEAVFLPAGGRARPRGSAADSQAE